jgi:hypothetical protein
MPAQQNQQPRARASVCRIPPHATTDRPVRIISMAMPDHAPPVALRNHSLAGITVVSSPQTRTRATMLALTSHYSATNAKHPRHAPSSRGGWGRWLSRRRGQAAVRGACCPSPDRLTVTTGPTNPLAKRVRPDPSGTMFRRTGQSRLDGTSDRSRGPRARLRAGQAQPAARLRTGRAQPGARRGA